ncbi:MAG: Wzz/FepE/Etk N-terminal domain-containing protein [Candidatus Cloacimonetes bacterium]|nr:Wzz/FepE/Etk N-terminal domain-containing protein [Candidatus Cloacimonadota bacterium]
MLELDLIEVIRIVMKNRRLIIFIVSIAMVAAITYSMLAPMIWSSEAVFYARSNKSLELTQSASSMSKMIKDLVESSAQDEAMACVNIMKSRSFTEEVIRRYSLIDYFKLTDPDSLANMDDALERIPRVVFINYDEDENLVYVRVETKSKALSRSIADFT